MTQRERAMTALKGANEIRLARAGLKRRVFTGEVLAAEVLADPPEYAKRMWLGELLRSQDQWGAVKVERVLATLNLPENLLVGRLTSAQVRALCSVLPYGGSVVVAERRFVGRRLDGSLGRGDQRMVVAS